MKLLHLFQALLLACIAIVGNANTTTQQLAIARKVSACQDYGLSSTATAPPDPACWQILSMPTWMSTWNTTTTTCGAIQNPLGPCQCNYEEGWATCFMRLTFKTNRTANYTCTNISAPQDCSEPLPGHIVPGPAEIYYGAYSIWSLVQYLSSWYTALTSSAAIPAITKQLQSPKTSARSTSTLLIALMQQYAINRSLSTSLTSIIEESSFSSSDAVPTLQNAQTLLGQVLQSILDTVMSDWSSGDFTFLSDDGMLLNNTGETAQTLTMRLSQS